MSKNDSSTPRTLTGFYLADLMFCIGCAFVAERIAWLLVGVGI